MSLDRATLQNQQDTLSWTSGIEEADPDRDDTNPPLYQVQDEFEEENEEEITIQAVYLLRDNQFLASPHNFSIKPHSHPSGNYHTISASFVADVSGYDIEEVRSWARTGSSYINLEWNFTGHEFPGLETPHLLVEDESSDISFSGGTGFARQLLHDFTALGLPEQFMVEAQSPQRSNHSPDPPSRQSREAYSQDWDGTLQISEDDPTYFPQQDKPMLFSMSPPPLDDRASVVSADYTEDSVDTPLLTIATTASTWSEHRMGFSGPLRSSRCNLPQLRIPPSTCRSSSKTNNWNLGPPSALDRQLEREALDEQKRQARAMYADNGDASGMVDLMHSMSASPFSLDDSNSPYQTSRSRGGL